MFCLLQTLPCIHTCLYYQLLTYTLFPSFPSSFYNFANQYASSQLVNSSGVPFLLQSMSWATTTQIQKINPTLPFVPRITLLLPRDYFCITLSLLSCMKQYPSLSLHQITSADTCRLSLGVIIKSFHCMMLLHCFHMWAYTCCYSMLQTAKLQLWIFLVFIFPYQLENLDYITWKRQTLIERLFMQCSHKVFFLGSPEESLI